MHVRIKYLLNSFSIFVLCKELLVSSRFLFRMFTILDVFIGFSLVLGRCRLCFRLFLGRVFVGLGLLFVRLCFRLSRLILRFDQISTY